MPSFARLAVYSLATSVAIQLLNTVSGVVLARLLGPQGRGELAAILLWPGLIVGLGTLGLAEAVTFNTVRNRALSREIAVSGMALALILAMILMLLGWFLMPLLLSRLGEGATESSRIYLLWIPFTLVTLSAMASLRGILALAAYNWIRFAVVACTVLGLLLLAGTQHRSITQIVIVYVAANVVTTGLAFMFMARRHLLGAKPDLQLIGPILRFGLRAHLGTIWATANARADQAVIALTLTSVDLGLYAVAITMTAGTVLVGGSLAVITLPAVAGAASREQRLAMFARCTRSCLAISVGVAVLVFVATPEIVQLFFGPAFRNAIPIARVLVVASVALSLNPVLGSGLRGLNSPLSASLAEGIAAAVVVCSLILLVPRFGTLGAATAVALAYLTSCTWMALSAHRLGVPLREMVAIQPADLTWLGNRLQAAFTAGRHIE